MQNDNAALSVIISKAAAFMNFASADLLNELNLSMFY